MKNGKYEDLAGKTWYKNDQIHREDGPAVEWWFGRKAWFIKGKLHREDGPAVEEYDGSKYWYLHGKYHREDGPAIEFADGSGQWFLKGNELTEEEFSHWLDKKNLYEKLHSTLEPRHNEKKSKI